MDRKRVLGRASLSFPATDGVLDIDQILETDPWNEINDFVQQNFMQNILDEFNERVTLDPTVAPTDNKSQEKKRPASSSRTTRKSRANQTNGEKPPEGKSKDLRAPGGAKSKERKTEIPKKSDGNKIGRISNDEKKQPTRSRKKAVDESKIVEQTQTEVKEKPKKQRSRQPSNRLSTEPASKSRVKKQPNSTKNEKKVAHSSSRKVDKIATVQTENEDTFRHLNNSFANLTTECKYSKVTIINASTPKIEKSQDNNSPSEESTVTKNDATVVQKKPASPNPSPEKLNANVKIEPKDVNNNFPEFEPAENENVNATSNEGGKSTEKMKKQKLRGKKLSTSREKQTETASCNKCNGITTTGKKKIGKFEQRLLDKRERRKARKIRREEKKAERAMEKFSYHVSRIARKMGYLPEYSSCSSSDSEDEYSDFTDESFYSSSCCSDSSCSCCTSCSSSSELSEYTPCSSSD